MGTYGAEISLAWDANSEADLAGYNIYYGTASRNYTHRIDVGNTTEHTVAGLDDGGRYYFAATAYDQNGNESAYSTELVHTCSYGKPKPPPNQDSDGDGTPDERDDFPIDPDETIDTDGDGLGNNADLDDDNDGMPDSWESQHGLDSLIDDAREDSDGDGNNNLNEYLAGTDPHWFEDSARPDTPVILVPSEDEIVSQTPVLKTDGFYDPDPDNLHAKSQWQIFRADDDFCVYDTMSASALTSLTIPRLILEAEMDYIWRVRFFNHHGEASSPARSRAPTCGARAHARAGLGKRRGCGSGAADWSAEAAFTTDFADRDLDGNGVPDHQEVDAMLDLDQDGVMDRDQDDIKCIDTGNDQMGLRVRDADNRDTLISMAVEDPDDEMAALRGNGRPAALQFGLLSFKLRVKTPGDETMVTIYLSSAAADHGKWYKYNPINAEWVDYSAYIEYGADRKVVYLSLKDGGFGDADGIENGIIVDPLAFGLSAELDEDSQAVPSPDAAVSGEHSSHLDNSCFISSAASRPDSGQTLVQWPIIEGIELWMFIFFSLGLGAICLWGCCVLNLKAPEPSHLS